MEELIACVFKNKEWLFSGIGVAVGAWLVRLIFNKTSASSLQTLRSGNSSTNIQAGRDVNLRTKIKGLDVEE